MSTRTLHHKPIFNATEPLTVRVTNTDISNAKKRHPMVCALARGLTRGPEIISVRVGRKIALVEYEDRVVRYAIPDDEADRVKAFDITGTFAAGEYRLDVPKVRVRTKERRRRSGPSGKTVSRRAPLRHAWRRTPS